MSMNVCPFCGPRSVEEFVFHKTVADAVSTPYSEVYERMGHLTTSREHWQHLYGCGAWFEVQRNPSTADVLSIRLAGGDD